MISICLNVFRWIWIPIGLIGFLIISIVILAMLVVLSLIPTFLTTQHSSVTRRMFSNKKTFIY